MSLSELTLELDHSLVHQAYQSRELLSGVVCADGHGVAWYDPDRRPEPARYTSPMPIWSDPNLVSMGPLIRSRCVVAAIRNATVAGQNTHANCAPFTDGRWSWSLNGFLGDFDTSWRHALQEAMVPPERAHRIQGNTDGEWLFQAFLHRLDQEPEGNAGASLQGLVRDVIALAGETGQEAQLNILASDGERLIATRAGFGDGQNSLYHLADGDEFPGAHVLASEPLYDDPLWEPVPEDTVMTVMADAPPVRLRA